MYALLGIYYSFRRKKNEVVMFTKHKISHKDNRIISHTSQEIFEAESCSVTFEFQKKLTREDTISHHKSKDPKDGKMCPVYGWASVVSRIVNYPIDRPKLPNTPVNTVYVDNKFYQIPGELSF